MNASIADPAELLADRPAPGLLGWAERGWLPDAVLRAGIRRLCAQRLASCMAGGVEIQQERQQQLVALLRRSPMAVHADAANTQPYGILPAVSGSGLEIFVLLFRERANHAGAG